MKKQIRKLLHRFENLKFRKKLSVLMLIVGLVPVVFLAFSMQYGMTNRLPWYTEGVVGNPRHVWKLWDEFGISR